MDPHVFPRFERLCFHTLFDFDDEKEESPLRTDVDYHFGLKIKFDLEKTSVDQTGIWKRTTKFGHVTRRRRKISRIRLSAIGSLDKQ